MGSIAQKHIQAIRSIEPEAEIFALRHSKNGKDINGIKSIYIWDDITFQPDFILISNPTSEHAITIEKAIEFNCPLFIEKPSLHTLEKADELLKQIQERHIITYVGCDLRFHPALNFIKSYLEKNKPIINEVNIYCGSFLQEWRSGVDYKKVYSSIPEFGGGVHLDLIHEPDYCYWIFGKPLQHKNLCRSKSSLEIKAIDYANMIFDYPSFTASIILNYYRRDMKRMMEIVTDEITISVDLITGKVYDNKQNILFQSSVNSTDIYIHQMQHFIDCIKNKKESMNSFEESIDVLKLCIKS